jgi:hypothetical protein
MGDSMSSVVISGDTSGAITLSAPAVAGTNTLTLPATTATIATLTTPSFASTIGVGGATASASGAGISFPATQSASTNANTLDDYEEGTWTPAPVNGTVTIDNNWYVKVGRLVTVSTVLSGWSDRSTNTQIIVGGLPFTPEKSTATVSGLFRYCNSTPSLYASSGAQIYFYTSGSAGYGTFNYTALNNASAELYINITYIATS